MDKKALLEWVQSLPEDVQVQPFEISERDTAHHGWETSEPFSRGEIGVMHTCRIENNIALRLRFTAQFEGEFTRALDPSGYFYNVRRKN